MDAACEKFCCRLKDCLADGTLAAVVFASPREGEILKIRGSVREIGGEAVLQLEEQCTEGRVRHRNLRFPDCAAAMEPLFSVFRNGVIRHRDGGSASLLISKGGKATYTEDARLRAAAISGCGLTASVPLPENDRRKERMLTGGEAFLQELGISDAAGRVHDKRQAKYRQICRFCEQVRDILKELPQEETIRVADLCCGKSYLSFAVYYCLHELFGRQVSMTCVDLKESVMADCRAIAGRLGFSGMQFLCRNIDAYDPPEHPHLVISLHACDTATDVVLHYAVAHEADVILSTPCCHRDLSRRVVCPPLAFVTEYPMLRDKLCTAATDGLRLAYLRCFGYKTDAIELIDPEDTPKNILLRGIRDRCFRQDSPEAAKRRAEYAAACRFLTGAEPVEFSEA